MFDMIYLWEGVWHVVTFFPSVQGSEREEREGTLVTYVTY